MSVPAMRPDARDTATKSPELLEQEQIASLAYAVATSDELSRRVTEKTGFRRHKNSQLYVEGAPGSSGA